MHWGSRSWLDNNVSVQLETFVRLLELSTTATAFLMMINILIKASASGGSSAFIVN